MQPWLVRGGVMGVIYAATETVLADVQVGHPTIDSVLNPVTLAVLVGVSGLWGGVDGWLRRPNRGMSWFYGGLIGGVLAGLLSVIAKAIFVDQTGMWALTSALTGDAAFVALLIMVPAGLGIAVGGRLEPPVRKADKGGTGRGGERAELVPDPVPRSPRSGTERAVRRPGPGGLRGAGR